MFKVDFNEIFRAIDEFPIKELGNLSGKLRSKCEKSLSNGRKSILSIFTIIIGYYLFSNAIIDKVGLGPFNIENINFILYFMPVFVSFFLWTTLSSLYTLIKLNYIIYRIELRQFGFSKRNNLISMSLPTGDSIYSIKKKENLNKKGCKSGCIGCFAALPALVLAMAAVVLIPSVYLFVVYYTVTNYNITHFDSRLLYWIPTIFTITFLFESVATLYRLYKFSEFRNLNIKVLDEED